jgi:GNAT superfamily N-acetyltransferase
MNGLRRMTMDDIPAGLSLCRSAGWNQLARDWGLFLKMDPAGSRVFVDDGKVIGTVTTIRYDDHFSWIGMVLVDPSHRRKGIGVHLLEESLVILKDQETVKLDATPEGRNVYLKLGFSDEYAISRMRANVSEIPKGNGSAARAVTGEDMREILILDREVFGADRRSVLEWMRTGAPELAFVMKESDLLQGYCFARRGFNFTQIGPVVAQDVQTAISLVVAALRTCVGHDVVIDALHHTPAWNKWLESAGFLVQRNLTRMFRGSNAWPGVPQKQFAILGPEFG